MKITFNDATELVIQSADIQSDDGGLLIKTISASEEDLKTMFQDKTKTKKMVVKERESTLGEYENYTNMDAIVKYTAGITGVILYKFRIKKDCRHAPGMHPGNVGAGISVMVTLLTNLFILLQNSGGKEMMAMLWAQQIMLGKKTYAQIPRLLKDKVKEILEDSGMGELANDK